jgi:hypothetical protein
MKLDLDALHAFDSAMTAHCIRVPLDNILDCEGAVDARGKTN